MVIQCPQCEKKYRIEEAEVPAGGAAVRCPKCRNIFTIYKEVSPIELVPIEAEEKKEIFVPPSQPSKERITPTKTTVAPLSPLIPPPVVEVEYQDEKVQEAKLLARSLVKDIVLYHKERVEEGLRKGTLVQLVGDEIRKSWSFYREQVSPEVLKQSDFFREALNEILAKGKKLFT